jgi:hypothetical protein
MEAEDVRFTNVKISAESSAVHPHSKQFSYVSEYGKYLKLEANCNLAFPTTWRDIPIRTYRSQEVKLGAKSYKINAWILK